jgi:folate-binding protein YgfZ
MLSNHRLLIFEDRLVHSDWQNFLKSLGAVSANDAPAHFGDAAAERRAAAESDALIDLSYLSLIRARGADTATFLQGQLSNDVRRLEAGTSQLSSYCTPKGRMLAVMRLFRRDGDCLLQVPAVLREDLLKRLRRFVLRSRVTLEAADDLVAFGLSGPRTESLLAARSLPVPGSPDQARTDGAVTVLRVSGHPPRFQIIAPVETATGLWRAFAVEARPCASPVWRWLEIRAGMPVVLPETGEAFVPQMANLDLVNGVNFKKGCYPGQEIVARLQYLGQLKQRMYLAHLESPVAPRPGDAVFAPDVGERSAGTIVDAQPAPEGGFDVLVVAQITSARGAGLRLASPSGAPLALRTLPYPLPEGAG